MAPLASKKPVKPVRNLIELFEADGPGCIKMLYEHGQRSALTIEFSNPLPSEAEQKGISTVTVKVMDKDAKLLHECVGRGGSKRLAKQGAAARAVAAIFPQLAAKLKPKGLLDEIVKEAEDEVADVATGAHGDTGGERANYSAIMVLGQYCERNSLSIKYTFAEEGQAHSKVFKVAAMVGDKEKGTSTGSKKKSAQTLAALDALKNLNIDLSTLTAQGLIAASGAKRKRDGEEGSETSALKSPRDRREEEGSQDRIKLLIFYCETAEPVPLSLELKASEEGQPHNKTFKVDAIIDGKSIAVSSAPKKKSAQLQAAASVLLELKVDMEELVQKYLVKNPPKRRRVVAGEGAGGEGGEVAKAVPKAKPEAKPARNLIELFEADGPGCIKMLNEHGQTKSLTIDYTHPLTSDSEKGVGVCTVTVKVTNKAAEILHECVGHGNSKKLAKQGAAARAVVGLFPQLAAKLKPKGLLDEIVAEERCATAGVAKKEGQDDADVGADGDSGEFANHNAILVLSHHCERNSLSIEYKFVEQGLPHAKVFKVSAMVGDEEKGTSTGLKKKVAQTMAAIDAVRNLEIDLSTLTSNGLLAPGSAGKRKRDGEEGEETSALKSPRHDRHGIENYEARVKKDLIKLLNFYCQTALAEPVTLELKVSEQGPPHNKTFTVDAIVDGKSIAVSSAPKKRLAQTQAAASALDELTVYIYTYTTNYYYY